MGVAQLPLISIKPIFENISLKAEQKTTVARYQTWYTNSTKGSIHESIWKNQQPPTVFLQDAKNHNSGQRRDTTHTTEPTPTTSLPPSRKFWYSLTVSNPSSHDRLFCLAFFCSASTQIVLMRTVGTTEYKGHLNLKHSTTKRHIKTHVSTSYVQLTGRRIHSPGFDNNIVTKHDVESHYTSLVFNGYAHFWYSRELYVTVA